MTDFFILFLLFHPEDPLQSPNLSPAVLPCLHMLQILYIFFFRISFKVDSAFSRYLLILSPPSSHYLHPEDPLEFYTVAFGCCITGVTRMMFGLLSNIKSKVMVAEAFFLFFPVTPELNGGS